MNEPIQVLGREALVKNLSGLSGQVLDQLLAARERQRTAGRVGVANLINEIFASPVVIPLGDDRA